tara:strand:- start:562 stop:741 length:180 start_codon:yes stop_codon:yes gene_type:complete
MAYNSHQLSWYASNPEKYIQNCKILVAQALAGEIDPNTLTTVAKSMYTFQLKQKVANIK